MKQEQKMSLTGKAINHLQQQYPNASFLKDIILQDDSDGRGPYIKYWGLGTPKPTEDELNQAAESMQPKLQPPSIEEQLKLLYEDQKNNTKTFSKRIDDIGKPI